MREICDKCKGEIVIARLTLGLYLLISRNQHIQRMCIILINWKLPFNLNIIIHNPIIYDKHSNEGFLLYIYPLYHQHNIRIPIDKNDKLFDFYNLESTFILNEKHYSTTALEPYPEHCS